MLSTGLRKMIVGKKQNEWNSAVESLCGPNLEKIVLVKFIQTENNNETVKCDYSITFDGTDTDFILQLIKSISEFDTDTYAKTFHKTTKLPMKKCKYLADIIRDTLCCSLTIIQTNNTADPAEN